MRYAASFYLIACLLTPVIPISLGREQPLRTLDQSQLVSYVKMDEQEVLAILDELEASSSIEYSTALAEYWQQLLQPGKVRLYLNNAKLRAKKDGDKYLQGSVAFFSCKLSQSAGNPSAALVEIDQAAGFYEEGGFTNEFAYSILMKAQIEHAHGLLPQSLSTYGQLYDLAGARKDSALLADCLYEMSFLENKLGITMPEDRIMQALAYYEQNQNFLGMANCYKVLGNRASAENDEEHALNHYLKAKSFYETINDHLGSANCLYNMGLVYQGGKKYEQANQHLHESLLGFISSGSVVGSAIAHMEIGRTYYLGGKLTEAEQSLLLARYMLVNNKNQSLQRLAQTYSYLGELKEMQGQKKDAADCYREAVRLNKSAGLDNEARLTGYKLLRVEPIVDSKKPVK